MEIKEVSRNERIVSQVRLELKEAPYIHTLGAWQPREALVTVTHSSNRHKTVTVNLNGPRKWAIETVDDRNLRLYSNEYTYALPYGVMEGNGENPIPSNLLITDLHPEIVSALEKHLSINFSDYTREAQDIA